MASKLHFVIAEDIKRYIGLMKTIYLIEVYT
jgi:hypothetical protein